VGRLIIADLDVTQSQAAQSLLGQGGIPNVGVNVGGQIKAIRLEHVWVEAYVDYVPSRGAINKTPDTWVPLDASFKQYQFTAGMDIKTNVPISAQNLLDQIKQGATINEAGGYVQNLNQTNLQSQLTAYQAQVKTYIDSQKANATVGDVLGTQTIVQQTQPILLGTLPYKTLATGAKMAALPDNLKWKFKTNIYAADGASDSSSPLIEINQSTAQLAGKKITLSFIPATQADQDLINSYLPKAHADGTPIQLSELPTSLPGYLLKMKAEFRIDGQVVAQTSQSFTMGSEVRQSNQYFKPADSAWVGGEDNDITVGEYNAIGIDLQGIGAKQLQELQARLQATKAKLTQFQQNTSDTTPINGLSKEDLAGDIVQTGIVGYFAQVDTSDKLSSRSAGSVVSYRLPSYGRFFTEAQTQYWYGIAKKVNFPGVVMDVDYLFQQLEAKDATNSNRINYMKQLGTAASAMEHAIPEMMFADSTKPLNDPSQPQGVSAVKALAIAASQSQKIYTLTSANQAIHSSVVSGLQISADVKNEITNALSAGKEVTVHEKDITVNGWTGCGYTILDPDTGAGAYKIAGGSNGGGLTFAKGILTVLGIILVCTGTVGIAPILLTILTILTVFLAFYDVLINATKILDSGGNCAGRAADLYLEIFIPVAIIASLLGIFGGSKTVEAIILKLMSIMYGGDLFQGVAASKACQ